MKKILFRLHYKMYVFDSSSYKRLVCASFFSQITLTRTEVSSFEGRTGWHNKLAAEPVTVTYSRGRRG